MDNTVTPDTQPKTVPSHTTGARRLILRTLHIMVLLCSIALIVLISYIYENPVLDMPILHF